ncbi:hypothetical protein GJAV_G00105160, partial [Gymnothorax javanicus]
YYWLSLIIYTAFSFPTLFASVTTLRVSRRQENAIYMPWKRLYLNIFPRMRVLAVLWIVLCGISVTHAALHSLKYFYTAVTQGIEFPEFTTVGLVDEEQFVHYDSNIGKMIPKTEWIKESVEADYWEGESQILNDVQQAFKADIGTLMQRFNQTRGVHTLQWMVGCEWDDESGVTGGFNQYGYNGEDFLIYDMKSQYYVAPVQQAFKSAVKWNHNQALLEHRKQYLTQECVDWLQKYVRYGKSSLERTVPPQVFLLQTDPSSPVTCHVTGFYPRGVMVTWQKDGQELDVDVELGETVPNGDGTFQTRSHLRVKPEDWKRDRYTCTVQHKSLEQDIILPVTEENIMRNMDIKTRSINPDDSGCSTGIIISCVVGALLLALTAIGVFMWKERSSDYKKTSTAGIKSDTFQKLAPEPVVSDVSKQPSVESVASDTDSAIFSRAGSTSSCGSSAVSEAGLLDPWGLLRLGYSSPTSGLSLPRGPVQRGHAEASAMLPGVEQPRKQQLAFEERPASLLFHNKDTDLCSTRTTLSSRISIAQDRILHQAATTKPPSSTKDW